MAAGISAAERIPEGDYSIAHRTPPPVPFDPFANSSRNTTSPPPGGTASEAASVHTSHSRKSSLGLGSLLRRSASGSVQSQDRGFSSSPPGGGNAEVPPVPSLPATRIAQAHQSASATRSQRSFSGGGKTSGEGTGMLRKSSRIRREEQDRLEKERRARLNEAAPKLPSHTPLPNIDSFGGENATSPSSKGTNFSRPGNAFAANMFPSSSPAYSARPLTQWPSPDDGRLRDEGRVRSNGESVADSTSAGAAPTESMANRGRYSYASSIAPVNPSAGNPRRVRRRKDPTPFNVLIVGAKDSGKTSLISFLHHSLSFNNKPSASGPPTSALNPSKSTFTSTYCDTEMDGERVGLTLWDSAGLEKHIIDLQLREMTAFVESKFEDTFMEEQKVMRSPGFKDTHIHCVFLVLDPVRLDATVAASQASQTRGTVSGLDDALDLQVMRALAGKTTVIPVISKADTLTLGHMTFLKRAVWESIKTAKLDPLEALELEDDLAEEDEDEADEMINSSSDSDTNLAPPKAKASQKRLSSQSIKPADDETPYIPMTVLSPDPYDLPPYISKSRTQSQSKTGRRFAWGFADPYNPEHCDFTRLRDSIFSEWRGELRDLSRSKWYENWRTSRLRNLPGSKQRLKGGVTPVAAVPKEGRSFSPQGANGSANGGGAAAVPRSATAGLSPYPPAAKWGADKSNQAYGGVGYRQ